MIGLRERKNPGSSDATTRLNFFNSSHFCAMESSTRNPEVCAVFVPPSIQGLPLLSGQSYSFYSPRPSKINAQVLPSTPCVLGVDEAGRGPVLGPMVYSAFYLPIDLHYSLLTDDHSFNDSKVLTPEVRSDLMRLLCTPGESLFESCGWGLKVLSARDISSGMMRPGAGAYNLNAQAMDATIEIIRGIVEDRGIDVREIYIDTIGNPATYQQKLERIFPTMKITVAKKADSLYPCVSAASVVAKVTRDAALKVCYEAFLRAASEEGGPEDPENSWGSGYPSDSKCVSWLRRNMDTMFGWGNECRFSWGTVKEMLETKGGIPVDWPVDEDDAPKLTDFLLSSNSNSSSQAGGLPNWYGQKKTEIF